MSDEQKVNLGEDKTQVQTPSSEVITKTPEQLKQEEDIRKEGEKLGNIQKAIVEANETLRKTREATKLAKNGKIESEELPKIDLTDPNSQAWDKHFNEKVNPLQSEMDKEKEEVRTYALQEFLKDKPLLAKDPEAIKKVMGTYERIRTASERTKEGVLIDLSKAYAAEFHTEILQNARNSRIDEVNGDAIYSDIAVSGGATNIPSEKEKNPHLNKEDELILAKWGLTPAEWVKMSKAQKK